MNAPKQNTNRLIEILEATDETLLPYRMRRAAPLENQAFTNCRLMGVNALYVIYKTCAAYIGNALQNECNSFNETHNAINFVNNSQYHKQFNEIQKKLDELQEQMGLNKIDLHNVNSAQSVNLQLNPQFNGPRDVFAMIYGQRVTAPAATNQRTAMFQFPTHNNFNDFPYPSQQIVSSSLNSAIKGIVEIINNFAENFINNGNLELVNYESIKQHLNNTNLTQNRKCAIFNSIKRLFVCGVKINHKNFDYEEINYRKIMYEFTHNGVVVIEPSA